jgi:HlyD family secretion protein
MFGWLKLQRGITIGVIALVLIGGFFLFRARTKTVPVQYVLGKVERGDLITKVKGTGQVSAQNQVDLKPQGSTQSSATISRVNVKQGDRVRAGQLVAVVDNRTALIALHQAQANLENSQADYSKVLNGSTPQSIAVSQSSVDSAKVTLANAQQSLVTKITSAYNDALSAVLTNTNPLFSNPYSANPQYGIFGSTPSTQSNSTNGQLVLDIVNQRQQINTKLPAWNADIIKTDVGGDLAMLTSSSQDTLRYILAYLNAILSDLTTFETNTAAASPYIAPINSARSTVLADMAGISSAQQTVLNARSALAQSQASLAQSQAPSRPEDVAAAQAQLSNYKAALESAQYTYDQSFLRAPFDGVVAQVNVSTGDQANTNTIVATIITKTQLAEISLNELDAAQVKVGATTTLTFDALPDVPVLGKVAQIDTIGTVTQGVVSYKAKISFDTQNTSVKPGMSVSASIQTNTLKNQLLVPASAVKTEGAVSTVLVPATFATSTLGQAITLTRTPTSVTVQTGETDNTRVVITGGLSEGQVIVARQVAGATAKAKGGLFSPPQN